MHLGFLNVAKCIGTYIKIRSRKFSNKAFSKKYLLLTNVSIGITLSGVGDLIQQRYEIMTKQLNNIDYIRTRNMSVSGCTVCTVCHFWYLFLDRKFPGRALTTVAKKVLLDQLVCSPIVISVFFLTLALLEGDTLEEFVQEFKKKAWKLYAAEWVIWPPAQIINFYILPTKYRVLYDNTISLGYDVYASYIKHDNS